jgi:hypothetical protein
VVDLSLGQADMIISCVQGPGTFAVVGGRALALHDVQRVSGTTLITCGNGIQGWLERTCFKA